MSAIEGDGRLKTSFDSGYERKNLMAARERDDKEVWWLLFERKEQRGRTRERFNGYYRRGGANLMP
ncbi:hypothetical protein KFK09_016112 [Dendrobium nobile]|uniref:Uncharacterized protein n=1 Tax=Dendrobium nobile TaxID=94219 RepID=A0A8T3AXW3_DENNO|nr:hypothetical protein KFK09_016112 [Dendrobium nobile]